MALPAPGQKVRKFPACRPRVPTPKGEGSEKMGIRTPALRAAFRADMDIAAFPRGAESAPDQICFYGFIIPAPPP